MSVNFIHPKYYRTTSRCGACYVVGGLSGAPLSLHNRRVATVWAGRPAARSDLFFDLQLNSARTGVSLGQESTPMKPCSALVLVVDMFDHHVDILERPCAPFTRVAPLQSDQGGVVLLRPS